MSNWQAAIVPGCGVINFTLVMLIATAGNAATPSVEQALQLAPVQSDVKYDQPADAEASKCTIKAEKKNGQTGWVVRRPGGQVLRRFVDTNDDNTVDQWSYFERGLEVYRDIDSNFNGKADEARWLNTGGTRWGVDTDEDGKLDSWKVISAQEASAEAVQALAHRDSSRFARLLVSDDELKSLQIGGKRGETLSDRIKGASETFQKLAARQKTITRTTQWVDLAGASPGVVPAGTDGADADLFVYDNAVAVVETEGRHAEVQIGTLIQIGNCWRLVDAPQTPDVDESDLARSGFFFQSLPHRPEASGGADEQEGGADSDAQRLMAELEKLDQKAANAGSKEAEQIIAERTALLEKIAEEAPTKEERNQWLRQLADSLSAAVQAGTYTEGVARLKQVQETLSAESDNDLLAYYAFRIMTAEYTSSLADEKADFQKIQNRWLQKLEGYIADYPQSPDSAEAMLQLGIAQEFSGEEEEATKWYGRLVSEFGDTPAAKKAAGAITRLESVGKSIELSGTDPNGKSVNLAKFANKVVVIHYWATWCEPCKADMAQLKELLAKYGKDGLVIVGINLDSRKEDLQDYLKQNAVPWVQMYEPGGLESRLANELGILTLPTMLLIGKDGKVANRSIHVTELDREVKALLR